MADRDRWDDGHDRCDRDFCCCKDEIAQVLRGLSRGACSEVEIFLTSGSDCCSITGTICDVRKDNCVLVLCETQTSGVRRPGPPRRRGKCYVAVDKIAAICEVCNGFPPGPPPGPPCDKHSEEE